jgi:hypothetical protein
MRWTSFRMIAHTMTLPFLPFLLRRLPKSIITGLYRIATSAGMKRAFRNRAWPTLQILGLPFMELPDIISLGARPMKATAF